PQSNEKKRAFSLYIFLMRSRFNQVFEHSSVLPIGAKGSGPGNYSKGNQAKMIPNKTHLSSPLELKKRKGTTEGQRSHTAKTSSSATMRDTNKLAISYKPPCIPASVESTEHDYKAYSIGQQRVQSMPQALAKSRQNPSANACFLLLCLTLRPATAPYIRLRKSRRCSRVKRARCARISLPDRDPVRFANHRERQS